jgi:L-ascorbate metabolism protein UlaG (beta-lactamase superfamily)
MSGAGARRGSTLTFIGTATTVLRLGPFTVLTDPNFLRRGQRAYLGNGMWSRRRTDPACTPDELPDLDALLLSHLHGDHFDRVARAWLPPELPLVTTRHAARKLGRRTTRAACGLSTWEEWSVERGDDRLRVTSVPARHGPALLATALPPVMGSVLDLERAGQRVLRVYVTGDTVAVPQLRAIGERLGDIDVLVSHLGGTRVLGMLVTMDARQGADLVEMLSPRTTIPVHYDDYDVFRSPLTHTVDEMRARGLEKGLRIVHRGDTVALDAPTDREPTTSPVMEEAV